MFNNSVAGFHCTLNWTWQSSHHAVWKWLYDGAWLTALLCVSAGWRPCSAILHRVQPRFQQLGSQGSSSAGPEALGYMELWSTPLPHRLTAMTHSSRVLAMRPYTLGPLKTVCSQAAHAVFWHPQHIGTPTVGSGSQLKNGAVPGLRFTIRWLSVPA